MRLAIYHVDAFAERLFTGNPASVVTLASWPGDTVLQAIAAENNLSETAFVRAADGVFELRWFTPRIEVPLCGHATLATAFVLKTLSGVKDDPIIFSTKSGALPVREHDGLFTMDFPAMAVAPDEGERDAVGQALGVAPREIHAARDRYLCVLDDAAAVRALAPDHAALARLRLTGLMVTAPDDGGTDDFVSRYFAPAKGVPEDPVTGAAHCALAPFWARRLGKARLAGFQASARGGRINCEVAGDRVLLSGRACLYMQGSIEVPD
ncbi:MAG: PhzF family phenazine biosynthesis protein [Hyphomicrobiaceae bacterium]